MSTEAWRGNGEALAAISNMVVGVYADRLGRGPTKARSFMWGDVVLCVLEDTLTKVERTLHESGRADHLLAIRTSMQEAMREALVAGIEPIVGRQVKGVISGIQFDPDISSEVFILGAPT